jgi:glycosyltransferase involved in cell wall biosynthesis
MRKKLIFVNGHLKIGGVERSLINLLKSIDYNEFEVDLVLFECMGDYIKEVPEEVNILFYDLTKLYGSFQQCMIKSLKSKDWSTIWLRLIFLLKKNISQKLFNLARPLFKLSKKYDCAYAYRIGICTDFVAYIVNSKKKVTWWHHGEYNYSKRDTKHINTVYQKFDSIVAVSESTKKMLLKHIPNIETKILTIPNIVDKDEIIKNSVGSSPIFVNNDLNKILVSVNNLYPEKRMINCVLACKKLINSGYYIKWYLIGEGPNRGEIEDCISNNNLQTHIYLLGSIINPYPIIKNAYIYVHPSTVESFSLSILEAFALNTPVVAAKSMGPMEFIRDRENGLLVEATPEGLYEGIVSLLNDKNLYEQLKGDKGDVLEKYHPKVVMSKVYGLIA